MSQKSPKCRVADGVSGACRETGHSSGEKQDTLGLCTIWFGVSARFMLEKDCSCDVCDNFRESVQWWHCGCDNLSKKHDHTS